MITSKKQFYINIIGIIISIIIGLIAIFISIKSIERRKPVFLIHPLRAKIVDPESGIPSDLELYFKGKPLVKKSVTAMLIYFWNAGKAPIIKEDILAPIIIKFPKEINILEVRILRQSRKVINFKTNLINDTKSYIVLYFRILEKDDGVALQIFYAGKTNAPITIEGTIKGCGTPIIYSSSFLNQRKKYPMLNKRKNLIVLIIYIFLWILLFMRIFAYFQSKKRKFKVGHNKIELKNLSKWKIIWFNTREKIYKLYLEKPEKFHIIFWVIPLVILIIILSIYLYYIYKLNIPASIFVKY